MLKIHGIKGERLPGKNVPPEPVKPQKPYEKHVLLKILQMSNKLPPTVIPIITPVNIPETQQDQDGNECCCSD